MVAVAESQISPVLPGDIIADKYRVERVLGVGGMGVVVSALHLTLDQVVAIKFLAFDPFGEPDDAIARFLFEARAAARIESDHVCRVFDVGRTAAGLPYMVMEYLEGNDLDEELRRRPQLAVVEAVDCVLQAADALAAAHQLEVVHRDIKPANLFLALRPDGSRRVKVLDFGISRSGSPSDAGRSGVSERGSLGTPAYMSPEQIRTPHSVDARTDIWALGAILYELLTGQTAFAGDTLNDILHHALHDDPCPIVTLRRDIPPELEAVIARCLARDRDRRWPSAAHLANALAPFGSVGILAQLASVTRDLDSLSSIRASSAPSEGSSLRAAMLTQPDADEVRSRPSVVKDWQLQKRRRTARIALLGLASLTVVATTAALVVHRWTAVKSARQMSSQVATTAAIQPPAAVEPMADVMSTADVTSPARVYSATKVVSSASPAPPHALAAKPSAMSPRSPKPPPNHLLDTRD